MFFLQRPCWSTRPSVVGLGAHCNWSEWPAGAPGSCLRLQVVVQFLSVPLLPRLHSFSDAVFKASGASDCAKKTLTFCAGLYK